jgi:uncharacterized protein YdeI (YjbR/CyaY-like superfamily)
MSHEGWVALTPASELKPPRGSVRQANSAWSIGLRTSQAPTMFPGGARQGGVRAIDRQNGIVEDAAELLVRDAAHWRAWLAKHHDSSAGIWLVLAKKKTVQPTSLNHDQALEEALCHGWIDGQLRGRDTDTYYQRFSRRRRRSAWSKRNIEIAERLIAAGRMHPAGIAELESARADGRSEAAYAGSASIEVPDDLGAALAAEPKALAMFENLSRQNRYAILYRISTAKRAETRERRVMQFVEMLARGETIHPQKRT